MTDAEREEIKSVIREAILDMAKEAADLMWKTPVSTLQYVDPWAEASRLSHAESARAPGVGPVHTRP